MNYRLLAKLLGVVSLLIGGTMLFSMPWAFPALGHRTDEIALAFETQGFFALLASIVVCGATGALFIASGRSGKGQFYRKEAMAMVGLSWVLATVLGALPFYLSSIGRGISVRLFEVDQRPQIALSSYQTWKEVEPLLLPTHKSLKAIVDAGARGLAEADLVESTGDLQAGRYLRSLAAADPQWCAVLIMPNAEYAPDDRVANFRVRVLTMNLVDSLFESQSGFSTTGATVISDLEDQHLVPHCILFWRSSMHFLGGLGIVVLFVAILGQGSIGKAMMRAEMPGPTKEGSTARMQHTAWLVGSIYLALNALLAVILWFIGMSLFDALCHAFGTMATGGFSTYNASVGHFDNPLVDYVLVVFMILAGSNFVLLYLAIRKPWKLPTDVEWRVYILTIVGATIVLIVLGLFHQHFNSPANALRYSLFQVVSIMTTTGYGTHDFDQWSHFGRALLLLLMFIGGCAGSTGGGVKVIRHILFLKVLRIEVERAFHPNVVRPLRLGGNPVEDPELGKNILVYFSLIGVIFVGSWMLVVMIEPDTTWGTTHDNKLVDCASAVAATLNNIGPGLGAVGPTLNYGHFSQGNKFLFVWLMMLGRLELFSILVLFYPRFWRSR